MDFGEWIRLKVSEKPPETRYEYISDPNDRMKTIKNPNYIPHSEYLEAVEVTMKVETVD